MKDCWRTFERPMAMAAFTIAVLVTGAQRAGAQARDQGPLIFQAEVVDSQSHRLVGVDVYVTITYARPLEAADEIVEHLVSDKDGRVRLHVAPKRVGGALAAAAMIWAYQPGRALALGPARIRDGRFDPVIRLTLEDPVKSTIKVVGPDDRSLEGFRLAPNSLRRGRVPVLPPEALSERLTVTTDKKGEATLSCLPPNTQPVTARVAGPGIAPHTLPVNTDQPKMTLEIGHSGRLVGVVRSDSGEPLAGVRVVTQVKTSGTLPPNLFGLSAPPEVVAFEKQAVSTNAQGAFQTPLSLLAGSTYRILIHHEGYAPFVSEWMVLSGEHTSVPSIRLRSLRTLAGQVRERQGQPVGGARVFLLAGGPSAMTDADGRFELRGALPDKTIVLVQHPGFRFQGWPFDPAAQTGGLQLTLVRPGESPDRTLTALPEPIPSDESRALAYRLLEPYLQAGPQAAPARDQIPALHSLATFDIERAVDLLNKGLLGERTSGLQRGAIALQLAKKDLAAAEAMLEPVTDPVQRALTLGAMAKALPIVRHAERRHVVQQAAPLVRAMPNGLGKLPEIAAVGEVWLDLGEAENARKELLEGLKLLDTPVHSPLQNGFLRQLARLEPKLALPYIKKVPTVERVLLFADLAPQLTIDDPAEAERFFQSADWPGFRVELPLRLCRRLARVDCPRARRFAASLPSPGARVCAWAFVALGLAEKDQAAAREALDRAIESIDRLRETGPSPEAVIMYNQVRMIHPTNPAALILPIVERVAPERLDEFFWRAVALHPRIDIEREELIRSSYLGVECMLLARYDRDVAAILFEPMDSYLRSLAVRKMDGAAFTPSAIIGKACLDPRAAVALVEALPPARDASPFAVPSALRTELAEALGPPPEERWQARWRQIARELPLDD
jgi:hypothetical protein